MNETLDGLLDELEEVAEELACAIEVGDRPRCVKARRVIAETRARVIDRHNTMLAALKAAVRQTQELYAGAPMEPSWLAAAEAAIAKAEGQR